MPLFDRIHSSSHAAAMGVALDEDDFTAMASSAAAGDGGDNANANNNNNNNNNNGKDATSVVVHSPDLAALRGVVLLEEQLPHVKRLLDVDEDSRQCLH